MSVTVEYYFRSDLSPTDLTAQIGPPLSCWDRPLEDSLLLGGRLTLGRCEEEDDGEMEFGAYNYELVLRTSGRHFRATLIPNMLSVVRVLQELFGYEGMLVYNLAILLARYDEKFVDTLSGTTLSDYLAHLTAVMHRMPEGSP